MRMSVERKEVQLYNPEYALHMLRSAIPFLQHIPDQVYFQLDTSELYYPSGEVGKARVALEEILGQHIMTYKRTVFNLGVPPEQHLCANLVPARLSEGEIGLLQTYERRFSPHQVSFVAYQNPVTLMDPRESALYAFYREKGLAGSKGKKARRIIQ